MNNIRLLRVQKNVSLNDLSAKTDIPLRTLREYEKGSVDIPFLKVQKIADVLDVTVQDLMMPLYDILEADQKNSMVSEPQAEYFTKKIDSLSRLVPVFDQYAHATEVTEWDTPEWLNERQFISTTLPEDGHYYWFPITGDSMCEKDSNRCINDGDFVLGRELYRHYWLDSLHIHRVNLWVIITPNGVMLKEIIKHNKNLGIITCHSWNKMYADFDIHLDNVTKLFYFKELRKVKF